MDWGEHNRGWGGVSHLYQASHFQAASTWWEISCSFSPCVCGGLTETRVLFSVMFCFTLAQSHTFGSCPGHCSLTLAAWGCPVKHSFLSVGEGCSRIFKQQPLRNRRTLLVHFPCHSPWLRYRLKMWHCRVLLPADCRVSLRGINWKVFEWRMLGITVRQHWFVCVRLCIPLNGPYCRADVHYC